MLLLSPLAASAVAQAPAYCAGSASSASQDPLLQNSSAILSAWKGTAEEQSAIKSFYAPCAYALAWSAKHQPTAQAQAMLAVFAQASERGLNPGDYLVTFSEELPKEAWSAKALAGFDLAMTVATMRLVKDLECGRVRSDLAGPKKRPECLQFEPAEFIWSRLAGGGNPAAALDTLEPQAPGYLRTKAALKNYQALLPGGEADAIPVPATPVSAGKLYAGLAQLQSRIGRMGDLPEAPPPVSAYEGPLVAAVTRFQEEHGLSANGILDQRTAKEINTPFAKRVQQLEWTLERWRAIPRSFSQPPVVVNIPEFRLRAYSDGLRVDFSMKVIVGKAYRHKTPVFSDAISSVVFRPYWNVPQSIQRNETAPALARDPQYLAKHNFEVVSQAGKVLGGNGAAYLEQIRSGAVRVREKPGPQNSLGLIKFSFPNSYSVYLHGTPAQQLFAQIRRDFSHGCIRVEDPPKLANWVLRNTPDWTPAKIEASIHGANTVTAQLSQPIPILIVYGTAFACEDGRTYFLQDIYGYDRELAKSLARLSESRKPAPRRTPNSPSRQASPSAGSPHS